MSFCRVRIAEDDIQFLMRVSFSKPALASIALTMPRVRWMAAGGGAYSFSALRPSIKAWIFLATTPACTDPGREAFCAPVSAMSPAARIFGKLSSCSCKVGRTRTNPLSGLINDPGLEGVKLVKRSLLGRWPVARMRNSVEMLLPSVNYTSNAVPSVGNPSEDTVARALVISLQLVSRNSVYRTPSSSNRFLISSCNFSWNRGMILA